MTTAPLTPSSPVQPESRTGFRMRWKWYLTALALLLVYGMWQCGTGLYQGRELSDAAVQHFHKQLNGGDYDGICRDADPGFTCQEKKEEVLKFLEAVHHKLGDAGIASRTSIYVNANINGTFVTTTYTTTFAHGTAVETFTWKKQGATLKLIGYKINSPSLVSQ